VKAMRLAILSSHPIQYYAPLFRHLAERIDLHVFFSHQATAEQQGAAGFGTRFTWDVDLASGYPHTFLKNVASTPTAARFSGCDTPEVGARLREGNFAAVLTLGWHLKSLLQGIWAAKRLGVPVMVRGDSQLSTPRGRVKRWTKAVTYPVFLRSFDAALYVGERNRSYYARYGYPESRLFRSPHCVDTERFAGSATAAARQELRARIGLNHATRAILFAGKLVAFKRPLDVVDAVAGLRARGVDAELIVAGGGELEDALRKRVVEQNVPLHFLGFQNQSQMPAAYAAADAVVLPSSGRETWGLVCNEALASGTPIVVSDAVGCAPDLAIDGSVGRVFPMGDTSACVEALGRLFASPPSRRDIATVSSRFTLASAADGVVEALSAIAHDKTAATRTRRT
jgi:glycosyltransferase involved in cell wall biosynthesis